MAFLSLSNTITLSLFICNEYKSLNIENTLSYFSNKVLIKKSHLVKSCIKNYELMKKEKEHPKISE